MTTTRKSSNTKANLSSSQHPLEPLTAEEVELAVSIVRSQRTLSNQFRFPTVVLNI